MTIETQPPTSSTDKNIFFLAPAKKKKNKNRLVEYITAHPSTSQHETTHLITSQHLTAHHNISQHLTAHHNISKL